jgi:serine/threonine protein kinase
VLSHGMFALLPMTHQSGSGLREECLHVNIEKEICSYYIMPKLGVEVEQYFHSMNKSLSTKSCLRLAIETLTTLEKVHESGYIYGDLKLDNILVGEGQTLPN